MAPYRPTYQQDDSPAGRRRPGLIAAVALAAIGIGACSSEPSLAPNELLVTYEHGETCKWTDWAFRYRRGISNNRASGSVMVVGPESYEVADDTTLRVFSADGEKLTIAGSDIREMRFTSAPDPDLSGYNEVSLLSIKTVSGDYAFMAEPLPKFSRSRVLVPVASHYFPAQSDDYMSWGNARLILIGTAEAGCSTDRAISLTRPGHPKKRTPVRIQFPGG
jgi:hypothetical protein